MDHSLSDCIKGEEKKRKKKGKRIKKQETSTAQIGELRTRETAYVSAGKSHVHPTSTHPPAWQQQPLPRHLAPTQRSRAMGESPKREVFMYL